LGAPRRQCISTEIRPAEGSPIRLRGPSARAEYAAMRRWAICHSGTRWTNPERPRLCLFTCYNTVSAKWGKGCPAAEVIAAMPAKRQTLFRGVWHGMSDVPGINRYYEEANRAV